MIINPKWANIFHASRVSCFKQFHPTDVMKDFNNRRPKFFKKNLNWSKILLDFKLKYLIREGK
jgi:hypothetical protein